jgi:hypothetical protein
MKIQVHGKEKVLTEMIKEKQKIGAGFIKGLGLAV